MRSPTAAASVTSLLSFLTRLPRCLSSNPQVLGFDAPSFTYGTDLILPVGANAELRFELSDGEEDVVALSREFGRLTSVPQVSFAPRYTMGFAVPSQDMTVVPRP